METLDIDSFTNKLKQFLGKELITPGEASKILLTITELLLDHKVDILLLKFLSRFLTQESYDEIVEEKNIEHQCGYLMCNNSPKQRVRRLSSNSNGTTSSSVGDSGASLKYQIYNRKPSIILPNTYSSQYCCKDHYQASLFYKNQLSQEALFLRKDILIASPFPADRPSTWYENGVTTLEEVLQKHRELKEHGKSLADVISMMSNLVVTDPGDGSNELVKLVEDLEIVERGGDLEGGNDRAFEIEEETSDREGTANGIEGYITSNKSFGGYIV